MIIAPNNSIAVVQLHRLSDGLSVDARAGAFLRFQDQFFTALHHFKTAMYLLDADTGQLDILITAGAHFSCLFFKVINQQLVQRRIGV